MSRRFTNIKVWSQVYVTSHADYWFKVSMDGGFNRDFCPSYGFDGRGHHFSWTAPKYLTEEVERQIVAGCKEGRFTFYEYDQDHNKRYEKLRYHDAEHVEWIVKSLEHDAARRAPLDTEGGEE